MYIGCARNSNEITHALKLAAQIFKGQDNVSSEINKKKLLSPVGILLGNDVVIIVDGDKVCGVCFLIDRFFYHGGKKIKGTFLSSICISESHRGFGLSKKLINQAIEECKKRDVLFLVLIARKAVDYFYNKFSFWGLSQYSTINFSLNDSILCKGDYELTNVTESNLLAVSNIYKSIYSKLYGACYRSIEYWRYILWKSKNQQIKFLLITNQNKVLGYVIFCDDNIYELSVLKSADYLILLKKIWNKYSMTKMVVHCSCEHPLVNELSDIDFSIVIRQCDYGGHMVRVLDKGKLLNIIRNELQNLVDDLGISNYSELGEDYEIKVKNGVLDVTFTGDCLSLEGTYFLMWVNRLSINHSVRSWYERYSFNIPYFDQI